MIANFLPNSNFTVAEKFFTEKLLEQIYHKTLDSHRTKLNNPKWVLKELYQVLCDFHYGKIKSFEKTISPVILESIKFLDIENELKFSVVNRGYFISLLGNQLKSGKSDYQQLSSAIKIILEDNRNYCEVLFNVIKEDIDTLNAYGNQITVESLERISRLSDYLGTELCNMGYSKGYLYRLTSRIFDDSPENNGFQGSFSCFKELATREKENFEVVFRIKAFSHRKKQSAFQKAINIKSDYLLSEERIEKYKKINKKTEEFLGAKHESWSYLGIPIDAVDYLSVIEIAKNKLFETIDLLHFGFPDRLYNFDNSCLVIGTKRPDLTNIQRVNYPSDGNYKNSQSLYDLLHEKVTSLLSKNHIKRESVQKIISALRHLRLGRESNELEQQFIHYWIGLEYIFSDYDVHESSITRLKEHFINSHSLAYVKRNFKDFHDDLKRLVQDKTSKMRVSDTIPKYHDSLEYLKETSTYDYIIANQLESHPLLAFRAYKLKDAISDDKKLFEVLNRHRRNLEWHLTSV